MEFQTNTQITETHVQVNLRWDISYLKTIPGILKCVALVGTKSYLYQEEALIKEIFQLSNLMGFTCVMFSSPYYREQAVGEWFVFVAMTAFWVSIVLLVMYLIHAMEKFHVIPWLMIEFGFCALWTFFFFSAALAAAVQVLMTDDSTLWWLILNWLQGPNSTPLGAASFFGFVSMLVYGYDSIIKFHGWRGGHLAQGERKVTNTVTHNTTQWLSITWCLHHCDFSLFSICVKKYL